MSKTAGQETEAGLMVASATDPRFHEWAKPLYCARCGVEFPEGLVVLGTLPLDDADFTVCAECAVRFGQSLIESGTALRERIAHARSRRTHDEGRLEDLRRTRRDMIAQNHAPSIVHTRAGAQDERTR